MAAFPTILHLLCLKYTDAFLQTVEVHDLSFMNVIHKAMEKMYTGTHITNASVLSLLERPFYVKKIKA